MVLMAIALLYRYADFVRLLGGTEFHLGWIVGIGIAGSIVTRLTIGSWIDRYGSRPLWIGSLLLFAVACLGHLLIDSYAGAGVYLLRIAFCCAVAGVNGASMTFVSNRGSERRIAEMVGMLGTAGFLGSVMGTQLGDLLFGGAAAIGRPEIVTMFILAASLAIVALPLAWLATRSERRAPMKPMFISAIRDRLSSRSGRRSDANNKGDSPSMWNILRRHNPGAVLAVGVAMGIGLGLPSTFLRPFAAELGIPRIGLFFLVYAATAIATRVLTRRWAERFGPRPLIIFGLTGLAASVVLFLLVDAEWMLVLPAIGYGCTHAVLFPSVVAAGSRAFPAGNRGMATLLMLATWDVGRLIGAPAAGAALRLSRLAGLPPYPTMYIVMSLVLAMVSVWYIISTARSRRAASIERQGEMAIPTDYEQMPPALPEPGIRKEKKPVEPVHRK